MIDMANRKANAARILLVLSTVAVVLFGALELTYFLKTIKPAYDAAEKTYLLGTCDGREVRVRSLDRNEPEKKDRSWLIEVDGAPIYIEIDKDKDGRPDQIAHFENGKRQYVSYRSVGGQRISRHVYYYEGDELVRVVRDANEEGSFLQRIRYFKDGAKAHEARRCEEWVKAQTTEAQEICLPCKCPTDTDTTGGGGIAP